MATLMVPIDDRREVTVKGAWPRRDVTLALLVDGEVAKSQIRDSFPTGMQNLPEMIAIAKAFAEEDECE